MGKVVEQGGGHLGVTEHRGPFAEAEVGCDDDAGALVKLAQQLEQQRSARGAERQVSQFIQDHEVKLGQAFGNLPGLALGLFLLKDVDQLAGGEEADFAAMVLDGLNADGLCKVSLAGGRATDQNDVLGTIHELAAVQGPYNGFVDLAGGEVEAARSL